MTESGSNLTRVQSSLELLCHTAALKDEFEATALQEQQQPPLSTEVQMQMSPSRARVTPAEHSSKAQGILNKVPLYSSYTIGTSPSPENVAIYTEDHHPAPSTFQGRESYFETSRGFQSNQATTAFGPPRSSPLQVPTLEACSSSNSLFNPSPTPWVSPMLPLSGNLQDHYSLRQELLAKNNRIHELEQQVADLQSQVHNLKQLPTGKISQIPVEDLLKIMQEYGSETSDQALPLRKGNVQRASVVRQFRRWNPNFFEYFEHTRGTWMPKLGKQAELERRHRSRASARRSKQSSSKKFKN